MHLTRSARLLTRTLGALTAGVALAAGALVFTSHTEEAAAQPVAWHTQVSTDNAFSVTSLTVPANAEVWLTLQNDGQAIHNWRVLDAKRVDGSDIGTKLLSAGESDTIGFVFAQPGTYSFLCDVHPLQMRGTVTVE
jgi:plastocyanin